MTLQLLRLEAINLSYVIDDTEDLSTRRGGGYMLLQAVRAIEKEFKYDIKPVSTGASIGLFRIITPIDRNKLIQEIHCFLNANQIYRHATFAVTIATGDEKDCRALVERSISEVRWQQMQTLNFTTYWGNSTKVCGIDQVRPIETRLAGDKEDTGISQSVDDRRNDGRKLRQEFYKTELTADLIIKYQIANLFNGQNSDNAFTNDTEALSQFLTKTKDYEDIPSNLSGKIAVFYADGNSFGQIQRNCNTHEEFKAWDDYIKARRRELLAALLRFLQQTPLGKTADDKIRFETLLWGGDEVLFILPAWLGLEFSQRFFQLTDKWAYQEKPLSHAAGLVFASHAAPISQLQKLAKKLADYGKAYDKSQNTVSWIVLESFDHAGDDMDGYWQRSGITQNGWQQLLLTQEKLTQLRRTIIPLKTDLPRSAIVRTLRNLSSGKTGDEKELPLLQRCYESVDDVLKETDKRSDFEALWTQITRNAWQRTPANIPPEDAVAWTVLMELWDYLLPDAPTTQAEDSQ